MRAAAREAVDWRKSVSARRKPLNEDLNKEKREASLSF